MQVQEKAVNAAYRDAPLSRRLLVAARPLICPFEPVIAAIPEGSRVLDVGCGVGSLLVQLGLLGRIRSGMGCDISGKSIAVARDAARHVKPVCLDFLQISSHADIPAEPVDVVCMVDVMHHIPAGMRQEFLTACASRLRPGGLLVYKDMNERPRLSAAMNTLHDLVLARQLIQHEPIERVVAWAAACGLRSVGYSAYRKLLYAHELTIFEKQQ